jgi:hypothetical protein
MANKMATMQGCCCATPIASCAELNAFLASKTQLEITVASTLVGLGWSDCTAADCQAIIDGTYILTKIGGSFGSGTCASEGSGHTFSYTFSESIGCAAADDPYTGIAVDFYCTGTHVIMRCLYRRTGPSCSLAYGHPGGGGIAFPADLSSGTVPPASPGSFTNPCVPTSDPMTFAFL